MSRDASRSTCSYGGGCAAGAMALSVGAAGDCGLVIGCGCAAWLARLARSKNPLAACNHARVRAGASLCRVRRHGRTHGPPQYTRLRPGRALLCLVARNDLGPAY